jgi:predicted nucleotidyltransferase
MNWAFREQNRSHWRETVEAIRVPNVDERKHIPMQAIRAVVRQIAEKFQPEKIILFGSYAHGEPRPESDVDLLVVMDTSLRSRQQRLAISRVLSPRPFPLDIVIRTPQQLKERIAMGDLFLLEITTQGKVLYERHRE